MIIAVDWDVKNQIKPKKNSMSILAAESMGQMKWRTDSKGAPLLISHFRWILEWFGPKPTMPL